MSPEDRERLYRALAKVEADGENADPKLTPNPHHSTDHDFDDPSFVEEVVRKLLSMAPDRQVSRAFCCPQFLGTDGQVV